MLYQLYLITNKINNKRYVGQTKQDNGYKKRFNYHFVTAKMELNKGKTSNALHNAMNKYGKENFEVKLLLKNIEEDKIDFYESLWINKLNTLIENGKGYNMTSGGQGTHNYKFTEDVRKRMSLGIKKAWERIKNDPIKYQYMIDIRSKNNKGKKVTFIQRKHISEAAKKTYENGRINPFKNKKHTDETKQKIALANGFRIGMYSLDEILLKEFISAAEAARYLVSENKTTNIRCYTRILLLCNGVKGQGVTAYGYKWKFL